jgi:hypothetical protein
MIGLRHHRCRPRHNHLGDRGGRHATPGDRRLSFNRSFSILFFVTQNTANLQQNSRYGRTASQASMSLHADSSPDTSRAYALRRPLPLDRGHSAGIWQFCGPFDGRIHKLRSCGRPPTVRDNSYRLRFQRHDPPAPPVLDRQPKSSDNLRSGNPPGLATAPGAKPSSFNGLFNGYRCQSVAFAIPCRGGLPCRHWRRGKRSCW